MTYPFRPQAGAVEDDGSICVTHTITQQPPKRATAASDQRSRAFQ